MRFRVKQIGSWARATALFEGMPGRARAGATLATENEAEKFHSDVKVGLATGSPGGKGFTPLSSLTLALRGPGKGILRRSDQMLNEIVVIRMGDTFAVTVRGQRSRIANIHEGGRTYKRKLTQRQLRWLFAAMKAAGVAPGKKKGGPARDHQGKFLSRAQKAARVGMTIIPPRPFFAPTYARYAKKLKSAERRVMSTWMSKIRGR